MNPEFNRYTVYRKILTPSGHRFMSEKLQTRIIQSEYRLKLNGKRFCFDCPCSYLLSWSRCWRTQRYGR